MTEVLRLPHDNWAILTVLVLMNAQYVGSIAVRAIMRVLGTIGAHAAVGVWLVGNYTSTPMIFLPVLFLVLAITSYKYGQFGARQAPYAYYLLGLTTLSVVTNGITAPDQVWQVGIDRTEEILLGAMVALSYQRSCGLVPPAKNSSRSAAKASKRLANWCPFKPKHTRWGPNPPPTWKKSGRHFRRDYRFSGICCKPDQWRAPFSLLGSPITMLSWSR